ncbi:MAG: pyridoxamine 5'-phosphate oxidase family protein, partial [Polyangiaceae bacterium]
MTYAPTAHTTLHRIPARGRYDRETVHGILDEALVCHLAFVSDGQPFAIPTTFARDGESL